MNPSLNRRKFLAGIGTVGAAGLLGKSALAALGDTSSRGRIPAGYAASDANVKRLAFAGTDGWISMPQGSTALNPWFPDKLAPDGTDTYMFGFRDVTGLERDQVQAQHGVTQSSSPLIWVAEGEELWLTLSNLGLAIRPDLGDSHTIHWHGFRNAIPFYDGVPETSIAVPIGSDFTYVYRPQPPTASDPTGSSGTYMYHCHFEDVEHVTMGMTGVMFVTPPKQAGEYPKYAYTQDPSGTSFDRQYAIILSELDSRTHFNDAHVQESDWTTFTPNFWLMNGRAWPDTIAPAGGMAGDGTPEAPPGSPHLANQPNSSRIVCAPGEQVLVRLANLGFQEQSFQMPGIPMRIIGTDARYLGPATSTVVDTIDIGPGESRDLLFTAPGPGSYAFFNRDAGRYAGSAADQWLGGQRTEVLVKDGLPPQSANEPNHWDPAWL